MPDTTLSFDHVHLVSPNPQAAAEWYVDKLDGRIVKNVEMKGAPQIYLAIGGFLVLVRGQRPAERAQDKAGLAWGLDHFGLRVHGDFDAFCGRLRSRGVTFSMEPTDINPDTRIAFIDAPDGVSIELLNRRQEP